MCQFGGGGYKCHSAGDSVHTCLVLDMCVDVSPSGARVCQCCVCIDVGLCVCQH